eukprot:scaffold18791_cov106-Isochrysis_galbana.AAC.10
MRNRPSFAWEGSSGLRSASTRWDGSRGWARLSRFGPPSLERRDDLLGRTLLFIESDAECFLELARVGRVKRVLRRGGVARRVWAGGGRGGRQGMVNELMLHRKCDGLASDGWLQLEFGCRPLSHVLCTGFPPTPLFRGGVGSGQWARACVMQMGVRVVCVSLVVRVGFPLRTRIGHTCGGGRNAPPGLYTKSRRSPDPATP